MILLEIHKMLMVFYLKLNEYDALDNIDLEK